jgi:hypothetical protein
MILSLAENRKALGKYSTCRCGQRISFEPYLSYLPVSQGQQTGISASAVAIWVAAVNCSASKSAKTIFFIWFLLLKANLECRDRCKTAYLPVSQGQQTGISASAVATWVAAVNCSASKSAKTIFFIWFLLLKVNLECRDQCKTAYLPVSQGQQTGISASAVATWVAAVNCSASKSAKTIFFIWFPLSLIL